MEIRVLGAHNVEAAGTRMMSLLVDGIFVLDAGGVTAALTFAEQAAVRAIFLSHRHYDHLRDVLALGFNNFYSGPLPVYGLPDTLDALKTHLLDGHLYPDLTCRPSPQRPAVTLCPVEPRVAVGIDGYAILPLPCLHSVPTVGYQVTSPQGRSLFYGADAGSGSWREWASAFPDILFVETTVSNRMEALALQGSHLSPRLLRLELLALEERWGYMPQVVIIHMSPFYESEIRAEVRRIAQELMMQVEFAYEGMVINL